METTRKQIEYNSNGFSKDYSDLRVGDEVYISRHFGDLGIPVFRVVKAVTATTFTVGRPEDSKEAGTVYTKKTGRTRGASAYTGDVAYLVTPERKAAMLAEGRLVKKRRILAALIEDAYSLRTRVVPEDRIDALVAALTPVRDALASFPLKG